MRFKTTLLLLSSLVIETTSCSSHFAIQSTHEPNGVILNEGEATSGGDLIIKTLSFNAPGDCTLVKLGDAELLVDCGAPANDVFNFVNENVEGPLDYLIITHQDDDHLGGYLGINSWVQLGNTIGTLIDFDVTKDATVTNTRFYNVLDLYSESAKGYRTTRDLLISEKKIEKYFTASQCTWEKRLEHKNLEEEEIENMTASIQTNNPDLAIHASKTNPGISDTFSFGTNAVFGELKILFNIHNSSKKANDSSTSKSIIVNMMSVCSMITYRGDKFLFTGDLMEFNTQSGKRIYGETDLIKNNPELQGNSVMFFRGGHHGSRSSNSAYFMSKIRPQYVSWSGIAGDLNHYNHPDQIAITNASRYTDKIFYTKIDGKYRGGSGTQTFYGNTTFTYHPSRDYGEKMTVDYESYYDEESEEYKKEPESFFLSSLFKNNFYNDKQAKREFPIYVYNLTSNSANKNDPYDVAYVKIGHIDILIGTGHKSSGIANSIADAHIIQKIKTLCNDHLLDYVIIPSVHINAYSIMMGTHGLLNSEDMKIGTLVRHNDSEEFGTKSLQDAIGNAMIRGVVDEAYTISEIKEQKNLKLDIKLCPTQSSLDNISINFLDLPENILSTTKLNSSRYSIGCVVKALGFNYLNLGTLNEYGFIQTQPNSEEEEDQQADGSENIILERNGDLLRDKIDLLQLPDSGYVLNNDPNVFYSFIKEIQTTVYGHGGGQIQNGLLKGLQVLANTTTSFELTAPFELRYPSSCIATSIDRLPGLQYRKNQLAYQIQIYPTQKIHEKELTTISFNDTLESDICFRALITYYGRDNIISYATNPNFSPDNSGLLFNNVLCENNNLSTENYVNNAKIYEMSNFVFLH